MMPATLSIITQAFPPEQRGTAIGTWAGVSALALAIGPVVGGFLTEQVSWRAIFFINPPIAVIALVVTLFAARESRDETVGHAVDIAGIVALTLGLTSLVLALVQGNSWHWGSPRIVGMFAFAVIALAAFVQIERRVKAPMIDFAFFRSRTSLGANLVGFLVTFAMFAQFFFVTLYMQNVLNYSPLQTGLRFLPSTVVIIFMGPLAGRLTDKVGARPLMTIGLIIVAAAIGIQSRITVHSSYGAAAARLRPDGARDGHGDVADEHRGDERRRPDQGRRRLRRAVDEPDGREHVRRGDHGRDRDHGRPLEDRPAPPQPPRPRHGRRSPTRSASAAPSAGTTPRRS